MTHRDTAQRSLELRVAGDPGDAVAHYRLAVLLLASRDLYEVFAPDADGAVARAEGLLERAVLLAPERAMAHAVLGFARHQLGRAADALPCFVTARRLDPRNQTVDVYVPALLAELGRESEALAEIERMARRHKVRLATVRRELAEGGLKADSDTLLTAFIRPSNYLWSWLSDEAERIRNSLSKGRKARRTSSELKECEAMSHALRREFRAARVPRALRSLAAAAARLGIGDDVCRPILMRRMPRSERTKLIRQVDALAAEVSAWLDSFSPGRMSTEAAAFMYLMESTDELR